MRGISTSLVVCLFAASVLAGCTSPPEDIDPKVNDNKGDDLRLQENWSYETQGGEFRYENGRFLGTYDGDQLVLKVNLTQPMEIKEFSWTWKYTVDYSGIWSPVFAMWNLEDPWPTIAFFAHANTEWGTVMVDQAGITVDEQVGPRAIEDLAGTNNGPETRRDTITFLEPVQLEPGEYRFWFGLPESQGMQIAITLPEGIVLDEPPQFSHGCGIVEPSDFESRLHVQAVWSARITDHAQWSTEMGQGQALLGYWYSFDGTSGITEKRYQHPDGPRWTYERDPTGTQAEPSDWDGRRITSLSPGVHTLEHLDDITLGDGGPKFVHCIQ